MGSLSSLSGREGADKELHTSSLHRHVVLVLVRPYPPGQEAENDQRQANQRHEEQELIETPGMGEYRLHNEPPSSAKEQDETANRIDHHGG